MTLLNICTVYHILGKLSAAQLAALGCGGTVCRERRGSGHRYRLRFRTAGRQVAISLGTSDVLAGQVRAALAQLQAPYRAQRELQAAIADGRRVCRNAKEKLSADVAALGRRWHGRTIRRPRQITDPAPPAGALNPITTVPSPKFRRSSSDE